MMDALPKILLVAAVGRALVWLIDKAAENHYRWAQILDLLVVIACFAAAFRLAF
jgi:alkylhydroperoxidase family enzyme